ncbi:SRPBCC domain-containing protein [Mucilaginibacter sp.]|uniref:SRPBCC family protein n=1 Tax=Mucilaginibacter sp. TaxID=1882438 RepID=UPI00284084DB|nr:SRPBCC domain-containing protein [Mucilaginibacter sp.]MDR3693904.1 SRPBCC domain-containing protein [Mucilaginibacter sp.]
MRRDLVIKWHLPHPPEKVWECITNPELLSQWLMKNDFKPIVGHRFNFHTKPIPKMGFDGIVYCEVLEIIPSQKLVYTWKGGPRPGVISLDTLLTWTLSPDAGGTLLVLEHTGFKGWKNYITSIFMEAGWKKHVTRRFISILNEMK